MRVLIIGFSRIVQRRVLPALSSLEEVSAIDIATRRGAPAISGEALAKPGEIYSDYEEALKHSSADLVYLSTVTGEHFEWAEKALQGGFHLIVDKPAACTLPETEHLVSLALAQHRCLAEAVVYPFHPLVEQAQRLVREADTSALHLDINFSFPPLDPENFRCHREKGGGAFLDLCRYAVSPGRIFFEAQPVDAHGTVTGTGDGADGIETGFSVFLSYPGNRTCTGHFGFDTEYRNRLTILAKGLSLEADRVFTPPADQSLPLRVSRENHEEIIQTDPTDSFANFILSVITSIAEDSWQPWASLLLEDARSTELLRAATLRN